MPWMTKKTKNKWHVKKESARREIDRLTDSLDFEPVNFHEVMGGRKINCVMRRFFPSSSVGDRPAPRGCTSTPDERKVTTI